MKRIRHCCSLLATLLFLSCSGSSAPAPVAAAAVDEPLHYLDRRNPTYTQAVVATAAEKSYRLVQVQVVEVVNPERHPLTFELHYQPRDGAKQYLGSFSLYPADQPGRFLVATQGKVHDDGAITLTVTTRDALTDSDAFRIGVRSITLVGSR